MINLREIDGFKPWVENAGLIILYKMLYFVLVFLCFTICFYMYGSRNNNKKTISMYYMYVLLLLMLLILARRWINWDSLGTVKGFSIKLCWIWENEIINISINSVFILNYITTCKNVKKNLKFSKQILFKKNYLSKFYFCFSF